MTEGQTEENCHTTKEQFTFILRYEDIEKGHFLFLGQAIFWIMSRGRLVKFNNADEEWGQYTECAHELFRLIDYNNPVVEGYPVGGGSVYEQIPNGIWASIDLEPNGYNDPFFSPIDEKRDNGGSIYLGSKAWGSVRIPRSFVLEHWPLIEESHFSETTVSPRKGAPARYDWDEFARIAAEKLELEGFPDPAVDPKWNQSALELHMADWCSRVWGKEPSESTIRKKVGEQLSKFKKGRESR